MNFKNNISIFLLALMLCGCNSDAISDCIQNAGVIERDVVIVSEFTQITVFENVQLILSQGDVQSIEIETGRFLRDEVSAVVEDGRLLLRNENTCNFVRDFALTTIYVTAPNITEIRSSTGLGIESEGVLEYPSLTLLSESFNNPEFGTTDGTFDLELDTQNLSVVVNGVAFLKLRGNVQNFSLNIAAGDSRIEAENLIAESVTINHRGTNDMLINPQQSVRGVIRGFGDVISLNRPAIVEVEELFRGRLIFRE